MARSERANSASTDLGTLSVVRREPLVLGAPSRVTRAVWLLGAAGCALFLSSVALTLGWLEPVSGGVQPGRVLRLSETLFWLLPLLLMGLALSLAVGGVRLGFGAEGLELRSLWPSAARRQFAWAALSYARFWTEETRSRERLYALKFVFEDEVVTCRVADEATWTSLKRRFTP